jgi:transposase-like protein
MSKHKHYDAELKTKVVLELLKGQKTLAQLCREYEVSPDLACHWRDVFLERAPQVFTDPRSSGKGNEDQHRIAELERMVGRLTMELDAAKKASRLLPSPSSKGETSSRG